MEWDNLYITSFYNWSIISSPCGEKSYKIYFKKYSGWAIFTYYPNIKELNILNFVNMYCETIEQANKIVYDVIRIHRWEIHPRYLGRYFKIKKLFGQKIEHDIMNISDKK